MQSLKKVFSSFVSMTTILWSVGGTLAFPNVASAATLNAGDLIKASGPAVYYYAANGKRYVFPNEKTYFTWYSGFSSVKTITDAELAAIMIGGNVTYRPGVKMVKITTDPKVYAVSNGGVLRHVPSEACAVTLHGANWNTQIEDVPDGFFVNYSVGAAINAGCTDYDKTAVMNASPNIGTDMGTSTPVGGSVSASLAADTPAGVTLPQGASSVNLLKVNVTAGAQAALVTGLRVHRVGVGSTTDFANVYLYDGNGARLTTGRSVNSSTQLVEFNGLNVTVAANSTASFVFVGDVSTSLTAGSQHAFELQDAASVILSGSGTVGGSFPVRGNTFTIGSTTASELDVLKGTTPPNPNVGAASADISSFKLVANTNDIEVRRVTLLQAGDISNSDLSDLKLWQGSTQVASAAMLMGDKIVLNFNPPFVIQNGQTKTFTLTAKVGGRSARTIKTYVEYTTDVYAVDTRYGTGAQVDTDDTGGFDGSTSGTKYIEVTTQGGTLTIAFNGPAAGNVAKASQDVQLYKFAMTSAESDLDVRKLRFLLESADGNGGLLEEGTTDYFTDLKVIDTDTGQVVMGPTSLAASATSGTLLTFTDTFQLMAGKTRNLAFTADLANSTDTNFVDQKFRACLSDNGDSDTVPVAAGTTTLLCGDSSDAIFQLGDVKIVSTGENLALAKIVPNTPITGNNQTVRSSGLSVALAASPAASTAVKKQVDIPAAGFVFTAGNESSIKVRTVKVTGAGGLGTPASPSYSLADLIDVVTSCALYDGATMVGTSQSPDSTNGDMTFTNLNWTIPAGASKTLTAKCTADSTVSGTEDLFALGILATDVTAEDSGNNEVTESVSAALVANGGTSPSLAQTVKSGGSLSVVAGSQPSANIVVAGAAKKFAEFTATAQYENVSIDRVTVSSTGDAANFTGITVRVAGADKGSDILPSGNMRYKDVAFSSPVVVTKDTSVTLELWGTLSAVQSSSTVNGATTGVARSGNTMGLGLGAGVTASPWDTNYTSSILNVMAIGAASGDRLYASGSTTLGNSMTLRKTRPTITKQTVSTNTLTSGSDTELYKFQMTPDAAGDVRWKQIAFTVTTSSASGGTTALDNFKLYRGSTQLVANTDVWIRDAAGNDITGGTDATGAAGGATIYVILVNEEVVTGSGNVYTLRATPTLTGSGNTVSSQFTRSSSAATGYLAEPAGTTTYGIDTATAADGTSDVTSYFIWSDVSEPVHGYATGTSSSRDWTNDLYLEDMTQTQTLSKS
jgi:hypothetical protein